MNKYTVLQFETVVVTIKKRREKEVTAALYWVTLHSACARARERERVCVCEKVCASERDFY